MKTAKIIAIAIGVSSLAVLPLLAGPVVTVQVPAPAVQVVVPAPVVTVPAPAVTVDVGVPDTYVWDGVEYVGVIGGQYYYLGSGNVWIVAEPWRIDRFHGWERGHPDWRGHAVRNDRYRNDSHGHYQQRHDKRDEGGH
jgi:hypothetical protein